MITEMVQNRRVSRLKALLDNMKNDGYKSYASIEREFDVSASFLSQLVNGTRSFGESAARTMEEKLGLSEMYFDDGSFFANADVDVNCYKLDSDKNENSLDFLTFDIHNKSTACKGALSHKPTVGKTVILRSFFKNIGFNVDYFLVIKSDDNSMSPYINDNDNVGINTSDCEIKDGAIYAICIDSDLMFKQVFREAGGALRLHSFNAEYPDRVFAKDQLDSIKIIGRQVYRAG